MKNQKNKSKSNTDGISMLLGGISNASSGLLNEMGYYFGKTREQRLVIFNQWVRDKDRANTDDCLVFGVLGAGKSYRTIKNMDFEGCVTGFGKLETNEGDCHEESKKYEQSKY